VFVVSFRPADDDDLLALKIDPDVPLVAIPANGVGTFHVGWFVQNARGKWEQDDEAARVFWRQESIRSRLFFVMPSQSGNV
jgi:hypothetical protein